VLLPLWPWRFLKSVIQEKHQHFPPAYFYMNIQCYLQGYQGRPFKHTRSASVVPAPRGPPPSKSEAPSASRIERGSATTAGRSQLDGWRAAVTNATSSRRMGVSGNLFVFPSNGQRVCCSVQLYALAIPKQVSMDEDYANQRDSKLEAGKQA